VSPPPVASASENQLHLSRQAVTALRDELARSRAHSEELAGERAELQRHVDSLRKRLRDTGDENEALRKRIRTLEQRISEITPLPPDGGESAANPAVLTATKEQPTLSPPVPGTAPGGERNGADVQHVVEPGETLYRIGLAYRVDYREIPLANGIEDPGRILVGQTIRIPGASRRLPVESEAPQAEDTPPAP